jgi:flagellar hook-basal body complex protein FliE
MAISMSSAISAYQNAAQSIRDAGSTQVEQQQQTTTTGESFAGLVKDSLQEAVELGKTSEKMSMLGMAGEADMREVVLAVNNAENALSTVVAIRDKVVSAYQEILKMPI